MILFAGDEFEKSAWQSILGLSDGEFAEAVSQDVFKVSGDHWRLELVGTLLLRDRGFACMPEVLSDLKHDMPAQPMVEAVSNTLRRYHSRSARRRAVFDSLGTERVFGRSGRRVFRQVEALVGLVDYTSQYGFHTHVGQVIRECGGPQVDWGRTISKATSMRSGRSIVYFQPESRHRVAAVSRLGLTQAVVLNELAARYELVLPAIVRAARDILEEAYDLISRHPEIESLSTVGDLVEAFEATNLDHEKELASLLIAAHPSTNAAKTAASGITVFGTTSFELVWEDICRVAFGSEGELDLSNPVVHLCSGKSVKVGRQRPDIVFQQNGQHYIVDAKYYPRFPVSMPGLEDFRKQAFYVSSSNCVNATAAFLFPGLGGNDLEKVGEARFHHEDDRVDGRFSVITLIRMNWFKAVDCYLKGETAPGMRELLATLVE